MKINPGFFMSFLCALCDQYGVVKISIILHVPFFYYYLVTYYSRQFLYAWYFILANLNTGAEKRKLCVHPGIEDMVEIIPGFQCQTFTKPNL